MRISLRVVSSVAFSLVVAGCSGSGKDKNESTQTPHVDTLTPATGVVGTSVTIAGDDFGGDQGTSAVTIGGASASVTSWSNDEVVVTVPAGAFPGSRDVVVTTDDGVSNAAAFAVTLPRALYVNDDIFNDNSIEGFALSAAGVATAMPSSPWLQGVSGPAYGGDGITLAVDAPRRRVFTTADEKLYAWSIDGATGVLTTTGSLALTGADYTYGLAVSPDGGEVYLADFGGGAVIGAAVASNGTLTALSGSPYDAGLGGTSKVQLSMDGSFLYVNNEDGVNSEIRGFIVGANGALAEMPNSPFNNPDASFAFVRAPDADRYYVSIAAYITAYEPNGAGDLTEDVTLRETVTGPLYLAFSGDGSRLFATRASELYVFDVAATGELVGVTGSPFTLSGVTNSAAVRVSADGTLAYVKGGANEFHLYTISAAGAPTEVSGSPFALRVGLNTPFATGIGFSF